MLTARVLAAGVVVACSATAVRPAQATLIANASLFSPLLPATPATTAINLAGVAASSQGGFAGLGYSVALDTAPGQGVVQGASTGMRAIPVAGTAGGQPSFLTGGLGSATTGNAAQSGSYFSTGGPGGSIVITFLAPQISLALLWGSIDADNRLSLNNATGDALTGAEVQGLTSGFMANGFQGAGGSAYVRIDSDTPFTSITLSSSVISFEAAGLVAGAAATAQLAVAIPEPGGLALVAPAVAAFAGRRRRRA